MNTKVRPTFLFQEDRYDPKVLDNMTYRNNISDPGSWQTDPEIMYELERRFYHVSSISRDRNLYPDAASFRISFPEPVREILSIELAGGVLPNAGNISSDGYLLLDIPELNHVHSSDGNRYFAILGLQHHPSNMFYNLDKSNLSGMPVTFKPVKARLDSLTVNLRHPDGSLVAFGAEDPTQPFNFAVQTSLLFDVRIRAKRRQNIDRDYRAIPPPIVI